MKEVNTQKSVSGKPLSVVPNLFTLLNLFFGCMAIVAITQPGLTATFDEHEGTQLVMLPENIYWGSVFIGIAAVIDFLDGFVARLLRASSALGAQLDSLADVVSFGVAPGMIVYQFLRFCYAQQEDGLDVSMPLLVPAFIIPCAGAYRLARFNLDTEPSYGFKGVPIPAAGLLIASFPLIFWYGGDQPWRLDLLLSQWFWYAVIAIVSYLMVSTLPMLALKFKGLSVKALMPFIIIAVITLVAAVLLGWMAVPVAFAAYVVISLVYKQKPS